LMKRAVDKRVQRGEKLDLKKYIGQILKTAGGTPVSLEVSEINARGMIEQGKKLYKLFGKSGNVYIKIPVNPAFSDGDLTHFDGILAIKELAKSKIPVNCTLVFTPEQALLAAKAGASFVSPFAGRVDDNIRKMNGIRFQKTDYYDSEGLEKKGEVLEDNGIVSGIDLVAQCVEILRNYDLKTEVLAASLRNPRQVREAALVGADIATLPFSVIEDMLKHFKTYEGMKKFSEDVVEDYMKLTKK
jgi:transaldolase